ncbi:unnamed protein product [Darwinula stevensoni]|uniref:Uncharacterized protein n=1 Tax=Darwinula stevensoni TaxID=69355 RepID=A0A7R9AFL9_9CRUS|nr:unnamed protein product [Darwinula stevensoni]CAG0903119.1 unnamed protein product [Darwinula stevensoni]
MRIGANGGGDWPLSLMVGTPGVPRVPVKPSCERAGRSKTPSKLIQTMGMAPIVPVGDRGKDFEKPCNLESLVLYIFNSKGFIVFSSLIFFLVVIILGFMVFMAWRLSHQKLEIQRFQIPANISSGCEWKRKETIWLASRTSRPLLTLCPSAGEYEGRGEKVRYLCNASPFSGRVLRSQK